MLTAYALLSSTNSLQLSAIYASRDRAEKVLSYEFPPGHVIYPDHKVVEIRIEIIG